MTSILQRWFPFTRPAEPIRPGVYASQPKPDAPIPYRLHLRVEEDGSGLLLVNASTVLHLNATATAHALELIRDATAPDAARAVRSRFRVSQGRALADQEQLRDQIMRLATQPDLDPVAYLGMERRTPFVQRLSAPYRIDLALTYATDPAGKLDPLASRARQEGTHREGVERRSEQRLGRGHPSRDLHRRGAHPPQGSCCPDWLCAGTRTDHGLAHRGAPAG